MTGPRRARFSKRDGANSRPSAAHTANKEEPGKRWDLCRAHCAVLSLQEMYKAQHHCPRASAMIEQVPGSVSCQRKPTNRMTPLNYPLKYGANARPVYRWHWFKRCPHRRGRAEFGAAATTSAGIVGRARTRTGNECNDRNTILSRALFVARSLGREARPDIDTGGPIPLQSAIPAARRNIRTNGVQRMARCGLPAWGKALSSSLGRMRAVSQAFKTRVVVGTSYGVIDGSAHALMWVR
jgi:hypothetical protein